MCQATRPAYPKLEDLAAIGANDPENQQMIRHLDWGIQENQLEEDSELRKMVGDFLKLGQQTLTRGKLIVKNRSNIDHVPCLAVMEGTRTGCNVLKI